MEEFKPDSKWFQVSLRIMGDELAVEDIEKKLNIQPSLIGKSGEHIGNNPRYAKYHTSIWVWKVTADPMLPFEQ